MSPVIAKDYDRTNLMRNLALSRPEPYRTIKKGVTVENVSRDGKGPVRPASRGSRRRPISGEAFAFRSRQFPRAEARAAVGGLGVPSPPLAVARLVLVGRQFHARPAYVPCRVSVSGTAPIRLPLSSIE